MKLAYITRRPGARRALKAALLLSVILITALGAFAAKLLADEHKINADLTLKLFKKNANGEYDVFDQARGAINLTAVTNGVGSGTVSTNHVWRFRSEKGRQVTVSLPSPGRFRLDVPNGWLNLELPFAVEIDGKRLNQNFRLTNESISTPLGDKGGQKAELEGRSLRAALIGFTTVKERDLAPSKVTGVVGGTGGLNGELVFVLEVNGRASW